MIKSFEKIKNSFIIIFMKKINNSDFESIQNIINNIDFHYEETNQKAQADLFNSWEEIIGNKISKFSKLFEISADNVLTVICRDSFIANELYYEKEKIFSLINKKAEKLGIKLKDIRFDYRKWKEHNL